uniref:Flavin-containing monooxygenase n=1 Tax=Cyberlindnera americana TaxID=36016 RepID=A0A5P8N8W1_9ASCO|nr:flavin-containing monooxygenase [Cyberlindnera americana]
MTRNIRKEIREVAVIGAGGVAGLASVYELLHTTSDGYSTVGGSEFPVDPYFTKIVGFEQKDDVGGTWYTEDFARDPDLPSQEILDTQRYDNVRVMRSPNDNLPSPEELSKSSIETPIITEIDPKYVNWSKSAIWPRLYTNVPESYMRYSTTKRNDVSPEGLSPFITHEQLRKRMTSFAQTNELKSRIRFNTEVYRVRKDHASQKWIITLRYHDKATKKDHWYEESFDGIILAQGSFSIPFIPVIKGLSEYSKQYPGSILHAKSYREPLEFKDKRVVVVGGNISAIDLGQYIHPVAKEVIVSRNLAREPYLPYMARCINSFKNVEMIEEFLPETKQLRLTNGEILDNVDSVILCTGYHIELPFLDEGILDYSIPPNCTVPTSNSRIEGLYQHVFNIRDPSIVFVGKLIVQALFRNMEAGAAAVAGVWSGASQLPTIDQMYDWEIDRLCKVEEHLFHKYNIYTTKEEFYDQMKQFYPKNRPDPLCDGLLDSMDPYVFSLETFEKLFNEFRTGKLPVNKNFNDDL